MGPIPKFFTKGKNKVANKVDARELKNKQTEMPLPLIWVGKSSEMASQTTTPGPIAKNIIKNNNPHFYSIIKSDGFKNVIIDIDFLYLFIFALYPLLGLVYYFYAKRSDKNISMFPVFSLSIITAIATMSLPIIFSVMTKLLHIQTTNFDLITIFASFFGIITIYDGYYKTIDIELNNKIKKLLIISYFFAAFVIMLIIQIVAELNYLNH